MITEELIKVKSEEIGHIALWKMSDAQNDQSLNIFLTHGTFSDKQVCRGIASYFVEKGYTCWIMEWRNHGASSKTKNHFNFETVALRDFPVAFEYLFKEEKIKHLNSITHSGGGTCLAMFLAKNQQYISKISKIAIFGCQATGAAIGFFNHTRLLLSKYSVALTGSIPAAKFGMPHSESYQTMKLWYDWNLKQKFFGENEPDYERLLPNITIPILSVYAKGDTFIAPAKGCRDFLDAFKNPKNKHLFCSKENGFMEDYNHSRILRSQNAKKEIFPLVLKWFVDS